ncbi:MAG: type II secretion system F family protein [Coriobacteriia bacterium]|nr:type II secretion system F family protein [Coriobacteriia bacterium]
MSDQSINTASLKVMPPDELSGFFYNLAMIFNSGMQLTEGFELLKAGAKTDREQKLISALLQTAQDGSRISDAFEQIGGLPQYALAMLKVAEQTGQMVETCEALSVYYDKRDRLMISIRSALIYPLAMMFLIFIIVVMLLTQAMPLFDQVLAQFGYEMSGLANTFLSVGSWLRGAAFGISVTAVLLIALALLLRILPLGKSFFNWLFENSPVTSDLSFRLSVQRLMLGMATMLRSGMTPQVSLTYIVDMIDDSRVRRRVRALEKNIGEGVSFQKALSDSQLIPSESLLLVNIGFRTGSNAEAFDHIAESLSLSTERQMVSLVSAIEPTLVALMTILVGIILLSVMLPLLSVLSSI